MDTYVVNRMIQINARGTPTTSLRLTLWLRMGGLVREALSRGYILLAKVCHILC